MNLLQPKVTELGGTPDIIIKKQDLSDLYLPILKVDFTIMKTYQYAESPH